MALLLGCSASPTEQFVEMPRAESAVEFLVQLREGRPLQIWSAIALGPGPIRVAVDEADEVAWVSVPRSQIEAADPLLTPQSLDRLTLEPTAPCPGCGGVCVEEQTTRLSMALPAGSAVLGLDASTFGPAPETLIAQVTTQTRLELLRTADECRWASGGALERFGAADVRLEADDQTLRVIDADRILVTRPQRAMLVLRGRDLADNARRVLLGSQLAHPQIAGTAVLSMTSTSVRLLMIARAFEGVGAEESTVYEVEATEDGFRVRGVRAEVQGLLNVIAATAGGGFVAVGYRGLVVTARAGEPDQRYTLGETFSLTALEAFPPELGPHHVGGAFGFVAEGDLFAGPAAIRLGSLRRGVGIVDSSVVSFRLRTGSAGSEVWAMTPGQGVFRRRGPGDWAAVDVDAPPGLNACAVMPDACGRSRLQENMRGIEFGADGRMFYLPWKCSTFFTSMPGDPCTQYVELEGAPQVVSEGLSAMRRYETHLFFVKDRQIWSLAL